MMVVDAGQKREGGGWSRVVAWIISLAVAAGLSYLVLLALLHVLGSVTDACRYDGGRLCVVQSEVGPIVLSDGGRVKATVELRASSTHGDWMRDARFDGTAASTELRDAVAKALWGVGATGVWRDPAAAESTVAKALEGRFPWLRVTFVRLDAST